MRRAARSLVEPQPVTIASDCPVEEAVRRLNEWSRDKASALKVTLESSAQQVMVRRAGETLPMLRGTWLEHEGETRLEGVFLPPPSALRLLKLSSIALALLIALAAWAFFASSDNAVRIPLALLVGVSVLLFPYAILALASHSLARQAALKRALERALRSDPK